MSAEKIKTPVTNRGVRTPDTHPLISTVDWFSCTFKNVKKWKEVCGVFCLDPSLFIEQDKGRNGYKKSAVWRSIIICYDGAENMGVFIDMSGQACREYEQTFEKTGFSWQTFFDYLLSYEVNVTRLDLAIDDTFGYFTLKQIENKIKTGCVVSKFRTSRNFEEFLLETGETLGQTIYFGKSDVIIRFYDKLEEREAKNFALHESIEFWQRTELQIRKERAMEACRSISKGGDLGYYICGILRNYLSFKIAGSQQQRYKWKNCPWWDKFLGSAERIKLTAIHPFPTIIRKKEWIDTQVVSSLATVYKALGEDETFFEYIKVLGESRMSEDHEMLVEEFKQSEIGKEILKDMRNFIIDESNKKENISSFTEFWYNHELKNNILDN